MKNEQVRQAMLNSVPAWITSGTFRQEVEGLLKDPRTAPALTEVGFDDSLTNKFLFALSSVEGMPNDALDDYIEHLTIYLQNPDQAIRDLSDPATPPLRWFALRIHQATAAQRAADPLGYMTDKDEE